VTKFGRQHTCRILLLRGAALVASRAVTQLTSADIKKPTTPRLAAPRPGRQHTCRILLLRGAALVARRAVTQLTSADIKKPMTLRLAPSPNEVVWKALGQSRQVRTLSESPSRMLSRSKSSDTGKSWDLTSSGSKSTQRR
jgi:hypothetical protein